MPCIAMLKTRQWFPILSNYCARNLDPNAGDQPWPNPPGVTIWNDRCAMRDRAADKIVNYQTPNRFQK